MIMNKRERRLALMDRRIPGYKEKKAWPAPRLEDEQKQQKLLEDCRKNPEEYKSRWETLKMTQFVQTDSVNG